MWPHYSPFYHVCILNPTYCSELSWIPGKNSFGTWNNLVWTCTDHLLNLSAWVPTITTTPMPWNFCTAIFTLCTRYSTQRDCWIHLGTLRQLKVCSSLPNVPFFQTGGILLFLHSHFFSRQQSSSFAEKLNVTLQKILCTSHLQNSVIFKKGWIFNSFFPFTLESTHKATFSKPCEWDRLAFSLGTEGLLWFRHRHYASIFKLPQAADMLIEEQTSEGWRFWDPSQKKVENTLWNQVLFLSFGIWQISVTWVRKDCQRGIQHYSAAFKHSRGDTILSFPLLLLGDVRNSKLLYLRTLVLIVFSQSPLFTRIHIYLLLEFCSSTILLDSRQELFFAVSKIWQTCPNWKISQAPYSSGHQNHKASMVLGLVWFEGGYFSFLSWW